ncbi:hypothetical protein GCM10029978_096060 [Actinoallomurus acanthiterrae]
MRLGTPVVEEQTGGAVPPPVAVTRVATHPAVPVAHTSEGNGQVGAASAGNHPYGGPDQWFFGH